MKQDPRAPDRDKPLIAFVVSLIAGIWMLAAGGMTTMGHAGGPGGGMTGGWHHGRNWMWHHEIMHGYGGAALWGWIGVLAAVAVLVAAVTLYARPVAARGSGIVILVASLVAVLGGAGGVVAGGLGVVGGVLALAWRPATA